ncbi:unnamed protein product [Enterobius vermicularis]|uniref:Col_cuticle_N domain-containing protein n=1 Tax=Enterobius vermicularis TaxID=51028 RepID=A0A0N4VHU0_ENTVE|nr:unnamed protein product [Enterobius vermicularis]
MVTKSSLYRSYKRFTVFVVPVIAATVVFLDCLCFLGKCYEDAAFQKVKMMKGKSLMYKDRIDAIPPGEDVWRW